MLILTTSEVEFCYVTHQGVEPEETLQGIAYQGHLFIKISSYAQDQVKKALQQCRQFLEREVSVSSIILQESNIISLWLHDGSLKIITPPQTIVPPQPVSPESNQHKKVIKYRGVEIVSEANYTLPSTIQNNSRLRYRGSK